MKNEETKKQESAVNLSKDDKKADSKAKSEKKAEDTAENKPKKKPNFNKKKLKYGSLATAITAIFIAAIVLLNVVVSTIMDRYPLKLDLTSDKLYEISQESIDYMKTVEQDIEIAVMYEESYFQTGSTYLKMVPEVLDKYRQYAAGELNVVYYDMTANPEAVNAYAQYYSGTIQEGDIVVKCGERVKVINFGDIIQTEQSIDYTTYQYVYDYTFVGEQSITSAIMSVTDANPKTVALITTVAGSAIYYEYNQYSIQILQELLEKNGYDVVAVDIMNDEISSETYDLVVLPAPYNDLTEAMVQKIEAFLYNDGKYGRNMLYIADGYQSPDQPNLEGFLEVWGIEIGDSVIYEGDASSAQYVQLAIGTANSIPTAVITENEKYNANLTDSKLPIVAPLCRPITLLWEANNDRATASLLQSSATAFLRPITSASTPSEEDKLADGEAAETTTTTFNQETAETGVQNLMAVSTTSFYSGSESYTSQLMVMGSCSLIDYYVAQNNAYRNSEYVIGAVNTMVGKEASIIIESKALEQTTIAITEGQLTALRNVVVILIPAIVILIGIVVYVRRRNR